MSAMGRVTHAKLQLQGPVLVGGKEVAPPLHLLRNCEDVLADIVLGAVEPYYSSAGMCRTL